VLVITSALVWLGWIKW